MRVNRRRKTASFRVDSFPQLARRLLTAGVLFLCVLGAATWQIRNAAFEQVELIRSQTWISELTKHLNHASLAAHELELMHQREQSGLKLDTALSVFQTAIANLSNIAHSGRMLFRDTANTTLLTSLVWKLGTLESLDEFIMLAERYGKAFRQPVSFDSADALSSLRNHASELATTFNHFQNDSQVRLNSIASMAAQIRTAYVALLAILFLVIAITVFIPAVVMLKEQRTNYDSAINVLQERNTAVALSEQSLSSQKQILQAVLNNIADAVVVFGQNYQITFQNPAARLLFSSPHYPDISFTDWTRRFTLSEFLTGTRRHTEITALRTPADLRLLQGRVLCIDNRKSQPARYFTVSFQTMTGNGVEHRGCVLSFHDVTARIENELVLSHAKQEAEAASRSKSEFLANISHEIRTPMTAILGYSDLLIRDTKQNPAFLKYAHVIRRNAQILMKLIDDILDLSKIEAGRPSIEQRSSNLVEILSDTRAILQARAVEKQLELIVTVEEQVPRTISTDPTRLRQILINLVGNAIKFTERGKVTLSVRYVHHTPQTDGEPLLEFTVSDTGCGIPTEAANNIFAPFVQVDSSASRRHSGAGLGLALSRRLARALGGQLQLQSSTVGVGSVFVATIKPGDVSMSRWATQSDLAQFSPVLDLELQHPKSGLESSKVLLVEDCPENRELISIYLSTAGATVDTAADGRAGLSKAIDNKYDVILLDIQLPGMHGYQVLESLNKHDNRTPVIALTAHAMPEERACGLKAGFRDYLVKPVTPNVLVNCVAKHIESRGLDNARSMAIVPKLEVNTEVDTAKWEAAPDAVYDIFSRFCNRLLAEVSELRSLVAAGDIEQLKARAHRLHGTAGNCGFTAVMEHAKTVDTMTYNGVVDSALKAEVDRLNKAAHAGVARFEQLRRQHTGARGCAR